MKIYLDVFFLLNVEMDFVVLLLETLFLKRTIRWKRLVSVSCIGGIFSTLVLVSGLHRFLWLFLPIYFVGSSLLIYLAFGRSTIWAWIKNVLVFYVTAALLSGVLLQLQSLWSRPGSIIVILSGSLAVLGAVCQILPCFERFAEQKSRRMWIRVGHGGKWVQGCALLDTGNQLREPFGNQPVAIANRHFLQPLWSGREPVFRFIPFHTVGIETGMLPAFYADCLEIKSGKGHWGSAGKTWIAVCENNISANGEFDLILHPDMTNNINSGG